MICVRLAQIRNEQRNKERLRKADEAAQRQRLTAVRVRQPNLVHIQNLPMRVATSEDMLRSSDFFGQFGRIVRVVMPNRHQRPGPNQTSTTVYITYSTKDEAERCIREADGTKLEGKVVKILPGTTRYCPVYLQGKSCKSTGCMFMHEPGDEVPSEEYSSSFSRSRYDPTPAPRQLSLADFTLTSKSSKGSIITNDVLKDKNAVPKQILGIKYEADMRRKDEVPILPATANWASNVPLVAKPRSHTNESAHFSQAKNRAERGSLTADPTPAEAAAAISATPPTSFKKSKPDLKPIQIPVEKSIPQKGVQFNTSMSTTKDPIESNNELDRMKNAIRSLSKELSAGPASAVIPKKAVAASVGQRKKAASASGKALLSTVGVTGLTHSASPTSNNPPSYPTSPFSTSALSSAKMMQKPLPPPGLTNNYDDASALELNSPTASRRRATTVVEKSGISFPSAIGANKSGSTTPTGRTSRSTLFPSHVNSVLLSSLEREKTQHKDAVTSKMSIASKDAPPGLSLSSATGRLNDRIIRSDGRSAAAGNITTSLPSSPKTASIIDEIKRITRETQEVTTAGLLRTSSGSSVRGRPGLRPSHERRLSIGTAKNTSNTVKINLDWRGTTNSAILPRTSTPTTLLTAKGSRARRATSPVLPSIPKNETLSNKDAILAEQRDDEVPDSWDQDEDDVLTDGLTARVVDMPTNVSSKLRKSDDRLEKDVTQFGLPLFT